MTPTERYTDRIWTLELRPLHKLTLLAIARSIDAAGRTQGEELLRTALAQTGLGAELPGIISELMGLGYLRLDQTAPCVFAYRITLGSDDGQGGVA